MRFSSLHFSGYAEIKSNRFFTAIAVIEDGSADTRLTNNMTEDRFPSWSGDEKISYTSNGSLFIMDADGSNQVKLLDSVGFPDWRHP